MKKMRKEIVSGKKPVVYGQEFKIAYDNRVENFFSEVKKIELSHGSHNQHHSG